MNKGQGCIGNPCGLNANCHEALGRPVCSCPIGYSGNPLVHCRRSECLDHSECASHLSCRNGNCISPCAGTCGVNADCTVRNHVPVCSCPRGYRGDPFSYCTRADPGLYYEMNYDKNHLRKRKKSDVFFFNFVCVYESMLCAEKHVYELETSHIFTLKIVIEISLRCGCLCSTASHD